MEEEGEKSIEKNMIRQIINNEISVGENFKIENVA